jgi:DNA-directed RNA polymerase subunit RPC12/RpoP
MLDFLDDYIELVITFVATVIIIGVIVVAMYINNSKDLKKWNNGYCSCGGRWEYQQAVGHRYDTDYIYKCDKCGKIEEFDSARDTQTDTESEEETNKCPSCGYYETGINYCPKCGTRMVK